MIPIALAQVDPVKPIADGLGANFLPYACGLLIVALIAVCKLFWDHVQKSNADVAARERAHDAELAALQKAKDDQLAALNAALLTQALAHAGEIRKTLEQVLPLQKQLAEMIHLTDRE